MSKVLKDKVKKQRIKWNEILYQLNDNELWRLYMVFRQQHIGMSLNRCAYYVLKSYYSTIALRKCKAEFLENGYSLAVLRLKNYEVY